MKKNTPHTTKPRTIGIEECPMDFKNMSNLTVVGKREGHFTIIKEFDNGWRLTTPLCAILPKQEVF